MIHIERGGRESARERERERANRQNKQMTFKSGWLLDACRANSMNKHYKITWLYFAKVDDNSSKHLNLAVAM